MRNQKQTTAREVLMEQKQAIIVNITDNAAEKVKTLMAQEGEEDLALRIGVRPGGCSGFQYSIYFDERSPPTTRSSRPRASGCSSTR